MLNRTGGTDGYSLYPWIRLYKSFVASQSRMSFVYEKNEYTKVESSCNAAHPHLRIKIKVNCQEIGGIKKKKHTELRFFLKSFQDLCEQPEPGPVKRSR